MTFSLAAKLHLIGQALAMAAQFLVPQLGLNAHTVHLVLTLLAYAQAVAGQWAIFVAPHAPELLQPVPVDPGDAAGAADHYQGHSQ